MARKRKTVPLYDSFSPTEYRYKVPALVPFLSEQAFVDYKSRVEAALARAQEGRGIISPSSAAAIGRAASQVSAEEVYDEETRTQHDVIAQVNMIRKRVRGRAKSAVHRSATSYDIVDTANSMRYRDAFSDVILPDMAVLARVWIDTARREQDTLQIGRTHLQHAEPITYGFAMAWYLHRFCDRIQKIDEAADGLRGKFSGAVGAYNGISLFFDDPERFEQEVMYECAIPAAEISTQIVPPEPLTDLVHYVISAFSVLANWADDMRNLMRPEIAEVGMPRGPDVSRSSTMPHKANPTGPENIKSLWKEVMPKIITMYIDQLSDHQRDLTNSASGRYVPEIFDLFDYAVRRATRVSKSITTHPATMRRNFGYSAGMITAEPLHLLLSAYGHHDSHRYVGMLADRSRETGTPLAEMAFADPELARYVAQFTEEQKALISDPSRYTGRAAAKAAEIADSWDRYLSTRGWG